jgi:hypothetical protein
MANDRSTALLKLLRGSQDKAGLYIVSVSSAAPVTLTFDGSTLALDDDLFEIPQSFQPLSVNDRFFTLPILGKGESQRWGLLQKIN